MGEGVLGGVDPFRTDEGRLRLGWRLLLFAVLLLGLALAATAVAPGPRIVAGGVAVLVGSLGAGWLLLKLDGYGLTSLGFHGGRDAAVGAVAGTALGAGVALPAVGIIAALGGVSWSSEPGSPGGWLAAGVGALALFALPAAAEEALLRGYPLQALAEAWGPRWALTVTSVGFGLMHVANPGVTILGVVGIVAAGVFLGGLYLRTGSLWWASGAHLGWNWALGFAADLPVSGLDVVDAPGLVARMEGPGWLSGGGFGPEGSVVGTALLLGAAGWTLRTGRLGRTPSLREVELMAPLIEREPRDGGARRR